MKVHCYDRQKDLPVRKRPLQKLVEVVLSLHRIETDQVELHLVGEPEICKLHEQLFDDPSSTDCISFPIDPDGISQPRILGEIFVCPKVALQYSCSRQLDPYRELALYIVHGLLHCIGFDDLQPDQRRKMRQAERQALSALDQAQLYLGKLQPNELLLTSQDPLS